MFLQSRRKPEKTHADSNPSSGLTRTILSLQIEHVSCAKSHDQQFSRAWLQTVEKKKKRRADKVLKFQINSIYQIYLSLIKSYHLQIVILNHKRLPVFCHQFLSVIQVLRNDIFRELKINKRLCYLPLSGWKEEWNDGLMFSLFGSHWCGERAVYWHGIKPHPLNDLLMTRCNLLEWERITGVQRVMSEGFLQLK